MSSPGFRQSSLFTFFQRKPDQKEKGDATTRVLKHITNGKEHKDEQKRVLENERKDNKKSSSYATPVCSNAGKETKRRKMEKDKDDIVSNKKRRRVIMSDSEDESEDQPKEMLVNDDSESAMSDDNEEEGISDIKRRVQEKFKAKVSAAPSTSTPRSKPKEKPVQKQRKQEIEDGDDKEGMSDLSKSFLGSFRADESLNASLTVDQSITSTIADDTDIRFKHLSFDFIKPEFIRDSAKRQLSDPDYDSRTLFVPNDFLHKQTPGLRQWWEMKINNYDVILLFKVGKFYELYHWDAVIAVQKLNLTYMKGDFAHCGFPEIAYERFADQLVQRGYKVARIEQTETPKQLEERMKKTSGPKSKVVRREICRIVTPGTKPMASRDAIVQINGKNEDQDQSQSSIFLGTESQARYLLAICERAINTDDSVAYGICFVDTSVGRIHVGHFDDDFERSFIRTLLAHYPPAQVLYEKGRISSQTTALFRTCLSGSVLKEALIPKTEFLTAADTIKTLSDDKYLGSPVDPKSSTHWPDVLSEMLDRNDSTGRTAAKNSEIVLSALGAIVWYLQRCLIDVDIISMKHFVLYRPPCEQSESERATIRCSEEWWKGRNMVLDGITLRNLNIVADDKVDDQDTIRTSLMRTLDHCSTAFGKRLLRQWLCAPLCDPDSIKLRQQAILDLSKDKEFRQKSIESLRTIPDLERLLQRIHSLGLKYRSETHPDGRAIMFEAEKYNKRKIGDLLAALSGFRSGLKLSKLFSRSFGQNTKSQTLHDCLGSGFPDVSEDLSYFSNAFDQNRARTDGVIIPEKGVDNEYDSCCQIISNIEQQLSQYLKEQRKTLNCNNINFFGTGKNRYLLEIPDSSAKNLSSEYEFKSQRKGFKRFSTKRTERLLAELQTAEEVRSKVLKDIMRRVFADFDTRYEKWSKIIHCLSVFDVLLSLAIYASGKSGLCMPEVVTPDSNHTPFIEIVSGLHPTLVEFQNGSYIANDSTVGGQAKSVLLITGPNMGGKSTLMRQVSILVVLAQMGSFVPATSCRLSPVDRIFTRLGASDRITAGQSTFYVELNETNVMLRDATGHSLVILDELGRGTATHDGTAIAYSVLRHLADQICCRTLFSTHYHSLVQDFLDHQSVALKHMACMVENENEEDPTEETISFMYQLVDGPCPKSHGFFAAKLAGIPLEVVRNAYNKSQDYDSLRRKAQYSVAISDLKETLKNYSTLDDETLVKLIMSCHL